MVWKKLESHLKADFPLFKVFEDVVKLPNGLELDYYWVDKIPVVVILPVAEITPALTLANVVLPLTLNELSVPTVCKLEYNTLELNVLPTKALAATPLATTPVS